MLLNLKWAKVKEVWAVIEQEDAARDKAICPKCNGVEPILCQGGINYVCQNCQGSGIVPVYNFMFIVEGPLSVLGAIVHFDENDRTQLSAVYMVKDGTDWMHYIPEDMLFASRDEALAHAEALKTSVK